MPAGKAEQLKFDNEGVTSDKTQTARLRFGELRRNSLDIVFTVLRKVGPVVFSKSVGLGVADSVYIFSSTEK